MYKVFVNNKPIIFIENHENISDLVSQDLLYCKNFEDKNTILEKLEEAKDPIYVHGDSFEKLWNIFFHDHKIVEAAGGVVLNKENEVLFIHRNGYWDLPKGKVEEGEQIEIAAIREVEEECGIENHVLESKLATTYHTYEMFGEKCIKPTYWYLMHYEGSQSLVPQIEEGITKVEWVAINKIENKMENTFGSIKDVMNEFLNGLA